MFNRLQNEDASKVVMNSLWLALEKVVRVAIIFVTSIYVARHLGPGSYGELNFALGFIGIFSVIATMGLNTVLVKEIVISPKDEKALVGSAFVLKSLGVLLMWILLWVSIQFLNVSTSTKIMLAVISIGYTFQGFTVIDSYFQAKVKSKYVVYSQLCTLLTASALRIIFVYYELQLYWFALVSAIEMLIGCFFLIVFYKGYGRFISEWAFDWGVMRNLFRSSWPLIFGGMFIQIQAKIDQVMLGDMVGMIEVGSYSVALRMIEGIAFLPIIICNTLAPYIANAKKSSEEKFSMSMRLLYSFNFLAFIVVAIPIWIFSELIVVSLYGEEYKPAGVMLSLMAIRLFFASYGVARSLYIVNCDLVRYSACMACLGASINVISNYFWIPEYKSQGAIMATIVSFAVSTFLADLFYGPARRNFYNMISALNVIPLVLFLKRNVRLRTGYE